MIKNRYRRITFYFAKVIISLIFWEIIIPFIRLRNLSANTRQKRLWKIAENFRDLATEMGGVMIKVGQFLSTRVDVLPKEITTVLANLQDEVTPEEFSSIKEIAEDELGGNLENIFKSFQIEPMAAASLGQVHTATLKIPINGIDNVVVKVQRPNIQNIIATDLAALKSVGKWINKYRPISKRADINGLLREFSKITFQEIDYILEGNNAEIFNTKFKDRKGIRIPKVIWEHTTKRVLTLENIHAIKITDYEQITSSGISRKHVAQRLFEIYLEQIFEDGFFHADPHPGNLFVEPIDNGDMRDDTKEGFPVWSLNIVDFGMVSKIPQNIRTGLRELAIGVGTRDTDRLIRSYQLLDILLPGADLELIKEFDKQAFERFYGKTMVELSEISWNEIHEFAQEFRDLLLDMPFQLPENLIFLGRCVAILSGMCTGLDPDFNVWDGIKPFAENVIREEAIQGWDFWREEIGNWGKSLFNLPKRLFNILEKVENGDLVIDTPNLNYHAGQLEKTGRRVMNAMIFAVLFISGVQLYLADKTIFGVILLASAIVPLWKVMFFRK